VSWMPAGWPRPFALAALLAFAALFSGCAMVRTAYDNADALVRYNAHDYFDLNEKQNEQLRTRVAQFHDWHRASELPLYAGLLREAAQRAEKGIAREDIAWAAAELRARYRVLILKAVNDAAPLLVTLSPRQIAELEKRLAKANEKYARDVLPADEEQRYKVQRKRLLERFRDWGGTLSDGQEARIERFARAHLPTAQMRFENRKRWQREAVELLRRYRTAKELAPRLADIFVQPERHRAPEFVQALAAWESDLTDLVLELDRTLSAEQRARVTHRMRRYAEDFEALSAQKGVAAAAAAGTQ
jgi:hypothetical protein